MKKKPSKLGGRRQGSGRKPLGDAALVNLTVRVPRALHEWLLRRTIDTQESASAIVRAALEHERERDPTP